MLSLILFAVMFIAVGAFFLRAGFMAGQLAAWAAVAWALFTLHKVSQLGMGYGYNWPVALIVLSAAWMGRKWLTR